MHLFRKLLATTEEYSTTDLKVEKGLDNYPELIKRREIKTEGLLVISSNKGLAGAYSSNIVKYALKRVAENSKKGIKTVINIGKAK